MGYPEFKNIIKIIYLCKRYILKAKFIYINFIELCQNLMKFEPFIFFNAFFSSLISYILCQFANLRIFYKSLISSIFWHAGFLFGSFKEFVLGFIWLNFYLFLWLQGYYIKYLTYKFLFFTAKYLWNFFFFIVDFIFEYFFEGTIILTFYKHTFKKIHNIINFFIFNGIPNLASREIWEDRVSRFASHIKAITAASINFIVYMIASFPKFIKRAFSYFLFFSMKVRAFVALMKKFHLTFKLFILSYYRHLMWQCLKMRLVYSRRGVLFWKKRFKSRMFFLKSNVKSKSLKYLVALPNIYISHKFASFKFITQVKLFPFLALLKHKFSKLSNVEINCHRANIFYQKLTRAMALFCLTFVSCLVDIQCLIWSFLFARPWPITFEQEKKSNKFFNLAKNFTIESISYFNFIIKWISSKKNYVKNYIKNYAKN
jgi:hypothetical protein